MPFLSRLRRPGTRKAGAVALTVAAVVLFTACGGNYPDSIFHNRTDFNRDVDFLFRILIYAGTAVFIFVEAILIWTLIRYRARPGQPEPEHVHGNTTLEIAWTVIPLLILIVIGIPTVRTILKTQATARSDALQVEVVGHQWWWEFRYPQFTATGTGGRVDTLVTANELYLPIGKTVNFALKTKDVIHSFWIPALAGKRDLIANRTNYLWFTPDSAASDAWNGYCVEFCGASHANMRFRAFTVTQAEFDQWTAHQLSPAPSLTPAPATAPGAPATPGAAAPTAQKTAAASAAPAAATTPAQQTPTQPAVQLAGFTGFPRERLQPHVVPETPIPAGLTFDDNLLPSGDAARGATLMVKGTCIGCHVIRGNPMMVSTVGPTLSHIASRTTIGAGLFPNTPQNLARWIKNAPRMKPGILMPSIGAGEFDPVRKGQSLVKLTDAEIADIVAYLNTLK